MQSKSTFLDYVFIDTNLAPPKNYSGANDVISIDHVLYFKRESSFTFCLACWCALFLAGVEFHVLPRVLVCFVSSGSRVSRFASRVGVLCFKRESSFTFCLACWCALFLAGVEFHVLPRVLVCFVSSGSRVSRFASRVGVLCF